MIKAVIFDLDGVIVTTDNCYCLAWKKMADEEGIYFDREINERLRGVSRMESLNIVFSKPDPEVFQKAAEMLGMASDVCMIVEDADAGIIAGKCAKMKTLAVGNAKGGEVTAKSLEDIKVIDIL